MSHSRRTALIALAGMGFAAAVPAVALQAQKFTPAAFAEAQKAGRPILVDVTAPWCPTCKAQKPILDKLLSSDKFKAFVLLEVDFDTQKSDLKALSALMQSTLIVFKGSTEVGRSAGDTNAGNIRDLLAKAL